MKRHQHLFVILISAVTFIACGSDQVVPGCTSNSDCHGARVCEDNICTNAQTDDTISPENIHEDIIQDVAIDVAPDVSDAADDIEQDISDRDTEEFVCPEVCTEGCFNGECHILHTENSGVQCPDNLICVVYCNALGSCHRSVTCGNEKCTILCEGIGSCRSIIDCGDSPECEVKCSGLGSCGKPIFCRDSECTVECGASEAPKDTCGGGIDCGTNSCDVSCRDLSGCVESFLGCEGADCGGAYTCNEADYCACTGPGCWPTPD